jgi:hypothetical protein
LPYDFERTISKLRRLHFTEGVFEDLAQVLRSGAAPRGITGA